MLPKPKNPMGYDEKELKKILKERDISLKKFSFVFGINTCSMDKKGNIIYYVCDVENALFKLGNEDGEEYLWD